MWFSLKSDYLLVQIICAFIMMQIFHTQQIVFAYHLSFTSKSPSSKELLLCNGNADICDLRYDQVTHAGTHNSGTYNLKYDCNSTIKLCKSKFQVPGICQPLEKVCEKSFPPLAVECFWENNPQHNIATQLKDGIRLFDFDTCLLDNNEVVNCHGMGNIRAIGEGLDPTFTQMRDFLKSNPNEVISIEFGDTDGDKKIISSHLQSKLEEYFASGGESMIYIRNTKKEAWPTLGKMIKSGQRIVVWFGSGLYNSTPDRKPWIQNTADWFVNSYTYTEKVETAAQLNSSFAEWCAPDKAKKFIEEDMKNLDFARWQTIDQTVGASPEYILRSIEKKEKIGSVCLRNLAIDVNYELLSITSNLCYPVFPYIYRVRVDYYWQSDLFKVVDMLNQMNVKRIKNGS
ncbi:hypothetical protein G9A89_001044 [Geosiphon pyriformis]|nr:hypothetical protein G9A89_001044 [Geosiphon pyriformis]